MPKPKKCQHCRIETPLTIHFQRRKLCPLCYEQQRQLGNPWQQDPQEKQLRYLTFEGLPGAGKRSQRRRLCEALDRQDMLSVQVERTEGVRVNYLPGQVLIGVGSVFSQLGYEELGPDQGAARFTKLCEHRPQPDLVFVLDVPVEVALERLQANHSPYEIERLQSSLLDLRRRYRSMALQWARLDKDNEQRFILIDGRRSLREVHKLVLAHITRRYPNLMALTQRL